VLSLIDTLYNTLQHALRLLSLLYLHQFSPCNCFQCLSFLSFVSMFLLVGSCLITTRLVAISHQPPTLHTAISRLSQSKSKSKSQLLLVIWPRHRPHRKHLLRGFLHYCITWLLLGPHREHSCYVLCMAVTWQGPLFIVITLQWFYMLQYNSTL
jgi:hypothetical protein